MERNRWETAIHCLEVALHPNTNDDEVIAAVNAFRRTANGTPLSEVCVELAGNDNDGRPTVPHSTGWREKLDRLNRENLDLRRKLEVGETSRIVGARRLHEAEQRVRDLSEKLRGAQRQASTAEQELADFRAASASVVDVSRQNFDPRATVQRPRQSAAEPEAAPPFRKFLAAARLGAETIITGHPPAVGGIRESSFSPNSGANARRPWTA